MSLFSCFKSEILSQCTCCTSTNSSHLRMVFLIKTKHLTIYWILLILIIYETKWTYIFLSVKIDHHLKLWQFPKFMSKDNNGNSKNEFCLLNCLFNNGISCCAIVSKRETRCEFPFPFQNVHNFLNKLLKKCWRLSVAYFFSWACTLKF